MYLLPISVRLVCVTTHDRSVVGLVFGLYVHMILVQQVLRCAALPRLTHISYVAVARGEALMQTPAPLGCGVFMS